jgi:hypothetical protein
VNPKASQYLDLLGSHYLVETFVDVQGCVGFPRGLPRITRIDIGLNMPVQVDPLRITAGLSFNRRRHTVVIPWNALLCARVDGVEYMQNHEAARVARADVPPPKAPLLPHPPRATRPAGAPALRLIKGGA